MDKDDIRILDFLFKVQNKVVSFVCMFEFDKASTDLVNWTIAAYGFLLDQTGEYSPAEFAAKISAANDETEPHTASALEFLARLEHFNEL